MPRNSARGAGTALLRVSARGTISTLATALLLVSAPAGAQQNGEAQQRLQPGETVLDRDRPRLDPRGVTAGGFLVFPSVSLEGEYNDNIFANPSGDDVESDYITHLRPNVSVESRWANHALNFRAGADLAAYDDYSGEDYEDYNIGVDGRYDVTRNDNLFGGASYRRGHEDRGSPDDVNGKEPTEYDNYNAFAGGEVQWNRVTTRVTATYDRLDYDDVPRAGGGTIDNDDRDRDTYEGRARISYQIQRRFATFVEGAYDVRSYDETKNSGFDRDSEGYELAVGMDFDLTGVTFGEVFAGYRSQDYDDPALETADGWDAGVSLTSNVSQLTSVRATFERSLRETTQRDASGYFTNLTTLRVDHELLRNLLLDAEASYSLNDYQGIGREDDVWSAGIGATYMVNRYAEAELGYTHSARDSSETDRDYDYTRNRVMLELTAQY